MDLLDFLESLASLRVDETEADTRARVIDPTLAVLGWTDSEIHREPYAGWADDKGYIDYLLVADERPLMVIEAKKSGRSFGIPAKLKKQRVANYKKVRASASEDLKEALDQCLRYSQHTGALYACATNGQDWIFFKPSHPCRPLPDAKVIIFDGADQVAKRLDQFTDLLSPEGMLKGRAEKELLGRVLVVPEFSKRLQDAFPYRGELSLEEEEYSDVLDQMLRHYVAELTEEADFTECYLPAKGNKTTSRSLEEMIDGRVQALRQGTQQSPSEFQAGVLKTPIFPSAASGRTVILHGEVGVGKTSFLRHCELDLRSRGKLEQAVWAKVDLLPFEDRQFGREERDQMLGLICKQIQRAVSESTEKMDGNFDPDVWDHLRDIYNAEVRRFQKGRFPGRDDSDPQFMEEARKFVWDLSTSDPHEHLVRVLRWLTIHCKLPVVIALDNSDQLGVEFQEFLFKLTETLKNETSAVVILVLRTEALASHSIREHSIAAVNEQFLVHKAPLAQVLQRRFSKILGALPHAYPASTNKVAVDRMTALMDTLEYEATLGSDAFQIVEASGNGSLRDSLRAVSAIFRSSPKIMDRLVVDQFELGRARLSTAMVVRAIMKDDLGNADATKLLPNVFNVDGQLTMPYALGVRQLQQVRARSAQAAYTVGALLDDFSLAGVDRTIAHRTLVRMRSDRFLRVAHMLPDLREIDVVRIARLGEVLLDIVLSELSYVSRTAFSTYIYDRATFNDMKSAWNSGIEDFPKKFAALGRLFVRLVESNDEEFRREIDVSLLEPVVGADLPWKFEFKDG